MCVWGGGGTYPDIEEEMGFAKARKGKAHGDCAKIIAFPLHDCLHHYTRAYKHRAKRDCGLKKEISMQSTNQPLLMQATNSIHLRLKQRAATDCRDLSPLPPKKTIIKYVGAYDKYAASAAAQLLTADEQH